MCDQENPKCELVVKTTFGVLRKQADIIKQFVAEEDSGPFRIRLSTAINHDLGYDGWDAWEFLDHFVERYKVNADDFVLTDYFSGKEPPEGCGPVCMLLLPFLLFSLIISLLLYPFDKTLLRELKQFELECVPRRKAFTVADLVTWSITNRFIPRNQVRYIFMEK